MFGENHGCETLAFDHQENLDDKMSPRADSDDLDAYHFQNFYPRGRSSDECLYALARGSFERHEAVVLHRL